MNRIKGLSLLTLLWNVSKNVLENIPTGVSCDPAKSRAFLEACQGSKDTILFCHDERPLTKEERESV